MKKRIFMLALVVGVLLSMCASAWAADTYYNFGKVEAEYEKIYKITARHGLPFSIRVRAYVNTNASSTGGYSDAGLLAFTVSQDSANAISGDLTITPSSDDITKVAEKGYIEAKLTGTISGDSVGTVRVTATMQKSDGSALTVANNVETSKYCEVVFTPDSGTESANSSFLLDGESELPIAEVIEATPEMKADPDNEFYDGIDPIFYSNPGKNDVAKAKAKLTTTKISDFKAGTPGTASIIVTGPVTEVDVYIAAKDANKLWPDSVDKTGDNIRLNKENIKKFKIPFRITESDDSGNLNKLTGAAKTDKAGSKKDKDNAKKMTTKFTLAFNGASVAYKGFPITFAVKNEEMSKAAAKALKINVTPNNNEPVIYRYEDVAYSKTISIDLDSGAFIGIGSSPTEAKLEEFDGTDNDGNTYPVDGEKFVDFTFIKLDSGEASLDLDAETKNTYVVSRDDNAEGATKTAYYTYNYTKSELVAYNKKAKPKQDWDIAVALTATDEKELGLINDEYVDFKKTPVEFYVSGDAIAPYIITVKGPDEEKNGIEAEIHQPEYDNLGRVITMGSVKLSGQLKKTDKESKTGVTITATNPSTKKKGTVKINVIGKVPAKFDKTKFEDAPDASDYTDDWRKDAYGKVVKTKNVEAGKVPSVSFKANGSKTIVYEISKYSDAGAEDLAAAGLSLDAKKGKIIALSTKDKVAPTVDSEGNFEPIDLIVHATNGIPYEGSDGYARALIGITGGKPAVYDKSVTFKNTDATVAQSGDYIVGTYKTFKLSAGKDKPAKADTANVKATTEFDLKSIGLELVSWESIDHEVSADHTVKSGDTIREADDETPYVIVTGSSYDQDGAVIASGDGDIVYQMGNTTEPDPANKNTGIFRIVDPTKMEDNGKGVKIDLALTNIGAEGTGKITLIITGTNSSSKKSSARNTVVVDATKAKTGKTGTAGSKYATLPDGAKAGTEAEEAADEATVTVGAPRTFADVTEAQKAFLAEKGYKVIAVLPEISATADGQQDFEVELDEDAPEGEKMVYVPFPKDVEETEDDRIADFYDEAGAAIEEVPEGKNIVVAPWLRADVVYQPVIAVEAAAE